MTITNTEPVFSLDWLPVGFYKIEDDSKVSGIVAPAASYNVSKAILIPKETPSKYQHYLVDEAQLALVLLTANDLHKPTNKEILEYVKKAVDGKFFICPATFLISSEEYSEIVEEIKNLYRNQNEPMQL